MQRSKNLQAKELLTIFFVIIALSFALFGNGINGDFVFDDRSVIVGNPLTESSSGVFEAFLNPYHYDRPQSGLYRPLIFASFIVDWHLFSGNPAGFHTINIFLHAISVFLIFMIVSGLKDRPTAIIASLLFLFLPIHVEAVTSIVGRGELLMFLFFLSSFLSMQKGYYRTAAAFFFLSLLSKETGAAFVPVFLFFEFFWKKMPVRELFKKTLYFIPPLAGYAALRYNALGFEYFINTNAYSFFNPIAAMNILPGLWTAFKVAYLYVQKIIFPTYFSSDYSYNQITAVNNLFDSWQALTGIGIFVAIIYIFTSKRDSLVGLGAAVFLFSYLVVSNLFIKIGTIMAERLMYMPSFGFVLIVSGTLSGFLERYKKISRPFWFVLIMILGICGAQTIRGNALWKNEKVLFENAYRHAPNSVVNITNMASVFFREGKNKEALEKINKALDLESKNSPTLHLGGQIYERMGEDKIAEEWWRKAILAQPDYLYPYLSLGALYYQRGDFKSGKEILLKAKEVYNTPNIITLLAFNQIGLEEYFETIDLIEEKFGKKPKTYELRFVLGVAYLKSGDDLKARELLLELKDPALSEDVFFQNLKSAKIFNIDI
jgi:protein O-mannosyl-transferase